MRFLEIAGSKQRGLNWDAVRDVPMPGVMVYDMRDLPMKGVLDETYNGVYNEHFIEHLTKDEGINFLKEMLRVMKPGGIIRTIWPPMEFVEWLRQDEDLDNHPWVQHYYQFYVVKHKFAPKGTEWMRIQDQCAEGIMWQNGEHKHVWAKQELIDTLKEIGYYNVREMKYQKSLLPAFNNIDTPGEVRAFHSAVVEAMKPL
jgi:predicted SAM-dependent methyltransferase